MKTMLGAFALVLAAPVAAQSAPAGDHHAGHREGHSQHKQGEKHGMECCKMACCEKMKQKAAGEKKGCCADRGKAPSGEQTKQHSGH